MGGPPVLTLSGNKAQQLPTGGVTTRTGLQGKPVAHVQNL
ncbi:hypothetical protein ABIF38_006742 [Bradyrhizobium japonicum]|nr:hypothetical protein [Bradyrhizobium elkanii]MCP1970013.1 hypothetical protein [Bradyrhizobium elkanii]MCS3517175.1 hypothetical protein [Bradyrhizobium elkanii]MCS3575078.1 hypothetical protein [Bradyrhizobium elkanii]MCS3592231.1 hypothetical protein [Bradyrhizobium elkanii]